MNITFISAGAGSGKTYTLIELISEAIENGTPPENILATTFTVKAAEEIRNRVKQKFLEDGNFEKAELASSVKIGTVNGICGSMLSDFAFEAGLSPNLKVCDETLAEGLLKKTTGSFLEEELISEFNLLEGRFGITKNDDSQWLSQLGAIINSARSYDIKPELLPEMAVKNSNDLLACIGSPLVNADQPLLDLLEDAIPAMKDFQEIKFLKKTENFISFCEDFNNKLKKGKTSWDSWVKLEKGGAGKNCEDWPDKISQAAGSWKTHPGFHRDIERYLELLFGSAERVMEKFAETKAMAGLIDFTDQEVLFYHLLENEGVKEKIKEKLDLLLVDEFQDTSPIQLALFLKLSGLAEKTYWIGDVKQSIYGFRGSDSALMEGILNEFEKQGTNIQTLDKSYRSRPSLVGLCNQMFGDAFADELTEERIILEPVRQEIPGAAFMHWQLDGNVDKQNASLVGGIKELFKTDVQVFDEDEDKLRPVSFNDIAVLCRTNKTSEAVRQFCRKANISLKTSGKGLLSTPEGTLIMACLRRLNDQNDTLASAEILGLTEGLSPEDWLVERLDYIANKEGDWGLWRCTGENYNPLLASLENLRPLVAELSPFALVDAVLARYSLDNHILSWVPEKGRARERMANLEAVRSMVAEYEEDTIGASSSLAGLILWLEGKKGDDELPSSSAEGITVTTWHKAKGLEWPVVVCHESWKDIRNAVWKTVKAVSAEKIDLDNPLVGAWIRFWPWAFGAQKKIDSIDISQDPFTEILETRAIKEERRLLYVGCTRARDLLVIPHKIKRVPSNAGYTSLGNTGAALFKDFHPEDDSLTLPNGTIIPYAFSIPSEPEGEAFSRVTKPIHWFKPGDGSSEYLPAVLRPSMIEKENSATLSVKIVSKHEYPLKWAPKNTDDPRELGITYHNAFAFFANNSEYTGEINYPLELKKSILSLRTLILELWPEAILHTELAVSSAVDNGQLIDARLDLLVETKDGYHIIDHKLTKDSVDNFEEFAEKYVGQLSLYKKAMEVKGHKPVLGLWLNLPGDGVLVEVGINLYNIE
jgi:ATP-dependent helicase/nuclease subunit A